MKRVVVFVALALWSIPATAHDHTRPDLDAWFSGLASGKGMCCSFTDGVAVMDVDWDTQDGHYRVRLKGQWITVPDTAVVDAPNKYGPAVVWPYLGLDGVNEIRCFLPGAGA